MSKGRARSPSTERMGEGMGESENGEGEEMSHRSKLVVVVQWFWWWGGNVQEKAGGRGWWVGVVAGNNVPSRRHRTQHRHIKGNNHHKMGRCVWEKGLSSSIHHQTNPKLNQV